MQIQGYLFFNRNCAEAIQFYERTLGAKVDMKMTQGQAPAEMQMPGADPNLVMHARLSFGDGVLMASDWISPEPYPGMHGFSLSIAYPTAAEGKRVFDALAANGTATMPMQETFWVEAFGMCTDRYGVPWMVNAGKSKLGGPG